ncbi:IS110 family transposase [Enterococcus casseliflavus]|uniref:IS110 family transposase n=1 Tax=Enterococcus casseliflavus TaxID=37734 RepID=UPI001E36992C|nr:IS110 family transposase [Enterococcus casseliflavus]MCD5160099.1 IS110 family transposase [Enterococcus casseliflavus]MCD5193002.1 IS110 family transposase [Enterococcus casseliflavus]
MKLFIGLDVSSQKLDTCFLTDSKEILFEDSLSNDLIGASEIKQKILNYQETCDLSRIVIGMESTSVYSFHPSMFFYLDEDLKQLPVEVTVENPYRIKQYSRMFDQDKTDKIDARIIADYLRVDLHTLSPIKEEIYVGLQRLTRSRYQLVTQMVEAKQHFLENLTYKCNTLSKELANEDNKTSVFGTTIMNLLTEDITLDEFSEMPLEEAAELLQKLGKGRFKNPEQLVKSIKKAVRSSYRLGKVTKNSIDLVLGIIANEIKFLKKQIKEIEKAITALLETIPEAQCLLSVPGLGPVYTAGLIAEIGQIERFDDQSKLAKYAGLTWTKNQSGNSQSENTPLNRSGNRYFRYYLIEATNRVRITLPEFKEYYQKKKNEVPKHKHKRALVLTGRKFVRLIDVLLRNGQLYQPTKVVIEK